MPRKVFLASAALAAALVASGGASAAVYAFTLSGYDPQGDGAVTGSITLDVTAGQATSGSAELSGGQLSPSPVSFSLVTSNCCGYPDTPPSAFTGWRAGDGTDWYGANTNYPIDTNGLVFESGPWGTQGTYVLGVYSDGNGGYQAALFGPGGDNNYYTYNDPITLTAVPEASTWAMLGVGFAALGFAGYRRARGGRSLAV